MNPHRAPLLYAEPETSHAGPAVSSPLVVISPHYDDAVFSCGHLLAATPGSTVVTVCTAAPDERAALTEWDERCGFACASEAMRTRAAENAEALALLGADGLDLNFLDCQYAPRLTNATELLSDSLGTTLTLLQPSTVCFPMGLFHDDHVLVSDALMIMCHHFPSINWLAYEDIPYRKNPEILRQRMDSLAARGVAATPFPVKTRAGPKASASAAYRSQFIGLGYADASPIMEQGERYWRIHSNMELL